MRLTLFALNLRFVIAVVAVAHLHIIIAGIGFLFRLRTFGSTLFFLHEILLLLSQFCQLGKCDLLDAL